MSDNEGKRGRVRKYERYLRESYMVDSEDAVGAYEAVVRQGGISRCPQLYLIPHGTPSRQSSVLFRSLIQMDPVPSISVTRPR